MSFSVIDGRLISAHLPTRRSNSFMPRLLDLNCICFLRTEGVVSRVKYLMNLPEEVILLKKGIMGYNCGSWIQIMEDVFRGCRNFVHGERVVMENVSQDTVQEGLAILYRESRTKSVSVRIVNCDDTNQKTELFQHALQWYTGGPQIPLLTQLLTLGAVQWVSLSEIITVGITPHINLQSLNVNPEVRKLLLFVDILSRLQIQQKCNSKILNIPNASELVTVCNTPSIDSKAVIKLLLFEEYSPDTKKIQPYTLEECKRNISDTLETLFSVMQRSINEDLNKEYHPQCKRKGVQLASEITQQKKLKHTKLSSYLSNSSQLLEPHFHQYGFQLHVIPLSQRHSCQWKEVLGKGKVTSDTRMQVLVRDYLNLRRLQKRQLQINFNRLRDNRDVSRNVKESLETILCNVSACLSQKHQKKAHISTLSKYALTLVSLNGYKTKILTIRNTHVIEGYLSQFNQMRKYNLTIDRYNSSVAQVQFSIRCFLLKRRLLRELITEGNTPSEDTHYDEMIRCFNDVLNRTNRLRQAEKRAFVCVELISVNNPTGSSLFSSQNILKFLKECSNKFKSDEAVESIQITDSSLKLITNYRASTYGIQQQPNSQQQQGGYGYKMSIKEGELYATGSNGFGELGLGDYEERTSWQKVDVGKVTKISCGAKQTLCLTETGKLMTWGLLKIDHKKTKTCRPVQVEVKSPVVDIESSNHNSFALLDTKQLLELNNQSICFKETSSSCIPFQIVCIRSLTLQIILLKKVEFIHCSLSLKRRKQILGEFLSSPNPNKYLLQKIPSLCTRQNYEHFNPHCVNRKDPSKQNTPTNLLE